MATITAPAPSTERAWLDPWTLIVLAAESIVIAGALHLVGNVQSLSEQLMFALLFFGVGPLQMLLGSRLRRGVSPVTAVFTLVVTVALVMIYVHSHSGARPYATGSYSLDVWATVVLGLELIAFAGVGALLPATTRKWITRALLGIGVIFWLGWFSITLV
jgi:hypothetical protein